MYPPHVPHGLAGHDLSALVNPSLQQGLSKPSVIAQVVDHSGSGHYDCASETNAYIGLLELSLRLGNSGQDPGIETAAPISEVGPDSCDPLSDRSSQVSAHPTFFCENDQQIYRRWATHTLQDTRGMHILISTD